MQEQPEKVSINKSEVISNSAAPSEESAQKEPFRAKFRSGTPRRKSEPVASTSATSEKRSSSRLPPLEVEVTGLRPVKRHAPAFFRDRGGINSRDTTPEKLSPDLENDILPPGRFVTEEFHGNTTGTETDTVPHFTDEEFDDWVEAPRSEKLVQQPRNIAPTHDRRRVGQGARPRRSQRASNEQRPDYQETRFNSDLSGQKENRRPVRSRNEYSEQARPSSAQQLGGHHGQRRPSRGSPQERRPQGHYRDDRSFERRGTAQQHRSSRNSAELIDTTAQRLYGAEPSTRSGWTQRASSRTVGDRRVVSERRRPIQRRFDDR
jgi:hypothetical protein